MANYTGGDGSRPDFRTGQVYNLKPEAMAFLLSYDALEQSRQASTQSEKLSLRAIKLARIAIWITGIVAFVQILLSLYLA